MAGNANNDGYIRLHRKFLEWEWYSDINTSRLFLHMLFKANWKPGRFLGVEIGRGEFVSSYNTLSKESGLSVMSVRTAVKHLISTGELTVSKHNKFTVFTIKNYSKYQDDNTQTNKQLTSEQQATNKQLTTIEKRKKEKREEDINTMRKANEFFERIWKLYPNKKGKGQVSDTQKKRLLAIGEPALVKAIERYSAALQKDAGWRKPQYGSTFFNSGYVDYLDENYAPEGGQDDEGGGSTEDFYRQYLDGCDD